jgi:hypothetical protein
MSAGNVASLTAGVYRYVAHRDELLFLATSGYERETLIDAAFGQDWIAAARHAFALQPFLSARL